MPVSNRPFPIRAAAAAGIFFFLLVGCGVKSGLEPPERVSLADPADKKDAAPKRITDQETSKVLKGGGYNLLPPDTPPEWEKEKKKKRGDSAERKAKSKSTAPDIPFILDRIL